MKKLKQKASFLTKILLVVGLLISNLSSLSVVFAYEGEVIENVVIELVDNKLEISYTEELAEEVKNVDVIVYENYTYLNDEEPEVSKVYTLTEEQLLDASEGKLELVHNSIFAHEEEEKKNFELFDGTYNVRVEIVDTTVYPEETVGETEEDRIVLADGEFEKEFTYESGLNIKVFDLSENEITLVDGKYPVTYDNSKVKVVAQILSGGLNPSDMFEIDGEEFFAKDLLAYEFNSFEDFTGLLFGDYELPVEVKMVKSGTEEEFIYNDTLSFLYESYAKNAEVLNEKALAEGYDDTYLFYSDTEKGILYVDSLVEVDEKTTKTILDLYNILEKQYNTDEVVSYTLLKNGINVLESYDIASGMELEEYLATITLDETVEIILSNEGLTVTFEVIFVGDLNNDNVITEDDVLELIDQVVSKNEELDLEKSDLYGNDDEVNSLDVLYLNHVLKTKVWEVQIEEEEALLDAMLDVKFNDEVLSEENYLVSGDEFTVDYVLSLKDYEVNGVAGVFSFDNELFELVSLEVNNEWIGNYEDGKFLYLGEESLELPEVVENGEDTVDYIILTATFRALTATDEESDNVITLDEIELFNSNEDGVVYYLLDNDTISTDAILVKVSDDNTLSYLEVAGVEIELQEGVYDYEITVSNDVTLTDLKYILNNVAANVILTNVPEELVEGENEIVITVTSESGVSQDYTIKVVREELVIEEEETTTQVNYENNYADDEGNQDEEVIVTEPTFEEDDEDDDNETEEESNLSRIVIIILILLVIAGLVYLIFKDEDDEETKKANKDVNKLKKENIEPEVIKNTTNKTSNKKVNNSKKTNNSKNNKKER